MNEQDRRIREYYEKLSMPQERLDSLLKPDVLEASTETTKHQAQPRWHRLRDATSGGFMGGIERRLGDGKAGLRRYLEWNALVTVAMAAALFIVASQWISSGNAEFEHTQRTVREVAMNHTTRLEPEFRGDTLVKLDNSMQQLPFELSLPADIHDGYELIGSRYCSLGGELAAHVRLKNASSGKLMSLFVTSNGAALKNVSTEQTTVEGVKVELWREGGLFFAKAQRS